jgi:hypothetical protein
MPSGSSVTISAQTTVTDWATVCSSYTAPSDGYVSLQVTSTNAYAQAVVQNISNASIRMRSPITISGYPFHTVIPVLKGHRVAAYGSNLKEITMLFVATAGGEA